MTEQVSFFGADTTLDGQHGSLTEPYSQTLPVNALGEVVMQSGGTRYLGVPGVSVPKEVSTSLGLAKYVDGAWQVAIGRSLHRIGSTGSDAGVGDGGCTPSDAGDGGISDSTPDAPTESGDSDGTVVTVQGWSAALRKVPYVIPRDHM